MNCTFKRKKMCVIIKKQIINIPTAIYVIDGYNNNYPLVKLLHFFIFEKTTKMAYNLYS